MNAAVLYGREDLKIERVDIPRVADDEVLVRVEVALTCGTDLKVWKQGFHARMIKPPALFGHELAGVIEEQGRSVNGGVHHGMRVLPANSAPCNTCFFCRKGQPNLCEDLLFNNGAYAEYIRIPAESFARTCSRFPMAFLLWMLPWQSRWPAFCAEFTKPAFAPGYGRRDRLRPDRVEIYSRAFLARGARDCAGQAKIADSRRGTPGRGRGIRYQRDRKSGGVRPRIDRWRPRGGRCN